MSAITSDLGHLTSLCLRSSARDPPFIGVLLKTKAQPQFDSPVDRAVEALSGVFQRSNPPQFQSDSSFFALRSAEGRKVLKNTKRNGFSVAASF
jgi:hypothetical protein